MGFGTRWGDLGRLCVAFVLILKSIRCVDSLVISFFVAVYSISKAFPLHAVPRNTRLSE